MNYQIGETVFFALTTEEVEIIAVSQTDGEIYYKAIFKNGKAGWWKEKYYSKIIS